jgi:hypothetical protein
MQRNCDQVGDVVHPRELRALDRRESDEEISRASVARAMGVSAGTIRNYYSDLMGREVAVSVTAG